MKNERKLTPLTFSEAFSVLHPLASIVDGKQDNEIMKRDFYKYDFKTISKLPKEHFPALLCVRENGMSVICPIAQGKRMMEEECARYIYVYNPVDYYLENRHENREARWFVLEPKESGEGGITEVTYEQAKRTHRRLLLPYLITVKPQLPDRKKCKVKIRFHDITLSRLKELLSDSRKIKKQWHDSPDTVGKSLLQALKWKQGAMQLGSDHHYDIYWNEKWHEFSFCEGGIEGNGICGGIVFHGAPDEGYKENGSVQIEPCYGWSSHT